MFADNKHNIRGMSRIGFKPNKGESSTFLFLFLPDGSAAGYIKSQELKGKKMPQERKHVGEMEHKANADGSWNYKFAGNMVFVENPLDFPQASQDPSLVSAVRHVKVDLHFDPLNPTYEYSEHMTPESLELGKKSGDEHWEQIGRISGMIIVGDTEYNISDVLGQRDHTHGIRDWTGIGDWLYYVVWFDEGLAVNPAVITAEDGKTATGGFLYTNGMNIPLKEIKILNQHFQEDGIRPVSSELELLDANGERHILKATAGPMIPIPIKDEQGNVSVLVQCFGSFELNSRCGGYGGYETLRIVKKQ